MFVLGIDPGLSRCGYCVIEETARRQRLVVVGVIRTPPNDPLAQRLAALQLEVRQIIDRHRPAAVAIERVLFQVNVRTAMSVGHASGVIMAEAAAAGAEVVEYSPNEVKAAVGGWGNAPKAQVGEMVRLLLGLDVAPQPADAADAAAVALCHLAIRPALGAVPCSDGAGASSLAGSQLDTVGGQVSNRVRRRVRSESKEVGA